MTLQRPKPTDPGIIDAICEGLIAGKSIREVCSPNTMPAVSVLYVEMSRNEELRNAIARARELQQDAIIDQTVDMSDDATPEDWQVVRMRIWARQWRAAKLAPKKYGEKQQVEHSGQIDIGVELTERLAAARKKAAEEN